MALIDVFNPSHESQTVIAYIKEQIKDSIKKQDTLNSRFCVDLDFDTTLSALSFEKQKIELLLTLANDLYGRRIIDKYVCRRLNIKNTCYECGGSLKKESVKYLKENGWKNLLEVREKITNESK
ncbi:MAG: hypothetical protein ACE5RM_03160 [Candidatus Nitrosomaritimum aestuariumsis]